MTSYGDPDLLRVVARHRGPVAVAVVRDGVVRTAGRGATPEADFELGSVSKGLTGLLYRDALRRGEVARDAVLADHLPMAGSPVGDVRLAELALHRGRLPRTPSAMHPVRASVAMVRHGTNPYGQDLDELLAQAVEERLHRPRARYSNVGFALLGHAVAAAAGTTYAALVRDRLVDPLGLGTMYVPTTPAELGLSALVGRGRGGGEREPWTGEGIGPAGGVRATVDAVGRLVAALLDGSSPGVDALEPRARMGRGVQIGAGWITSRMGRRAVVWHNGATGGFRSSVMMDRGVGVGVVVLAASAVSVDRAGFLLLADHAPT